MAFILDDKWQPHFRRMLAIWLGLLALPVAVDLATLTYSPPIWLDETEIVETGRLALTPDATWSTMWLGQRPLTPWAYPATVLQELAFRVTAPSAAGPRLTALLGALLASAAALWWLRNRGVPAAGSLLLSLCFFLDANFVGCYKGGRVDGWAIGLGLAAAGTLWRGARTGPPLRTGLFAGLLAGASFFVWPSAACLFPLLIAEAFAAFGKGRRALVLLGATVGALGATLLILLPIADRLPRFAEDFVGLMRATGTTSAPHAYSLLQQLFELRTPAAMDFALLGLCVGALVVRRRTGTLFASAAMLGILAIHAYLGRWIYFLPYMICIVGDALIPPQPPARSQRAAIAYGLLGAVATAALLSLILRPATAWKQRQGRDEHLLSNAARTTIGEGPVSVYLGAIEFYYAGRALGWHLYRSVMPDDNGRLLLHKSEWAIVPSAVPEALSKTLADEGFRPVGPEILSHPDSPGFGAHPFGPYQAYRSAHRVEPTP